MFNSFKFPRQIENQMWKRWQLFHAIDFQSLMYPNFTFCRILGIFPYKINALTFETSRLLYIQPIFFLCAFCIYESITLFTFIRTIDLGLAKILEVVCFYLFGGLIAIITYASSGPRMHVLQAIMEISSRLPPKLYRKLSRWIHIKDILGTFFLIIRACIAYMRYPKYFAYQIFATYIILLIFQINMQYINCTCVLKACFKRINDNLMHMKNVMIDNKSNAPRLICDTQKNQFLFKLKTLKKQHLIVSDTIQMLNRIFNLQLLATIAMTLTEITFEIFSHLMHWQDGLSVTLNDEFYDIVFLTSLVYGPFKLIWIVWSCETVKNQAFEIGNTVHDVINCIRNEQVKGELQLFSLQISHCARNTFSMKGLSVDAKLLASMTGSTVTYILILAQFLVMSHSCDRKISSNIT